MTVPVGRLKPSPSANLAQKAYTHHFLEQSFGFPVFIPKVTEVSHFPHKGGAYTESLSCSYFGVTFDEPPRASRI